MEYNTELSKLIIPEYGRNVQRMVEYLMTIDDKEKRNHQANAVIEVMGNLNPHLRDVPHFKHKLWDHLFIMSEFKLDVDTPYEKPLEEELVKKPDPMEYPQSRIRLRHFGKNILKMIDKASEVEDETIQNEMALAICNHMKKSYVSWNNSSVEDAVILNQFNKMAEGKVSISTELKLSYVEFNAKKRNSPGTSNNSKNNQKRRR